MAAENTNETGATPVGVKGEMPSLDTARQNFRQKVQSFVDTVKKYEAQPEQGPTSDAYQKLQGFLDNTALPKRNQEKEIINAMTVMARQIETKKRVVENMEKEALVAMAKEFKGVIKEAETAEEEFDNAYEENQKEANKKTTPSAIVPFVDVLDAKNNQQTLFVEKNKVMATNTTPEAFDAAANYYANTPDENGKTKKWGNVDLVDPQMTVPKLQDSAKLLRKFVEQIKTLHKNGLHSESAYKTAIDALSSPSLNASAHFLTTKSDQREKVALIQELRDSYGDFLEAKDNALKGIAKKEPGLQTSVDVENKKTNAPDKSTPKDNSNEQAASLTMKSGPK